MCGFQYHVRGGRKGEAVDNTGEKVSADAETVKHIKNAEKVFNALPTPLEIAHLIKGTGATFDETLLNPVENKSNYTTSKSMALNLGVFTCDLSFASMYDQTSMIINYMEAAERYGQRTGYTRRHR
ncbi:MAG: hypothetical protein MZV63_25420 [Marinilabiliales bacterium]|nr:hypothetical protein [Marinilabiliales bacterium]